MGEGGGWLEFKLCSDSDGSLMIAFRISLGWAYN